jgi:methionyl-tRNA formyltransferase
MTSAPRYVFFGTPRFAAIILNILISAGIPPMALVCNPDRPLGRKKIVTAPPTKQLIAGTEIAVLQPEAFDENFTRAVAAMDADFFVVAAYAKIIPGAVIALPRQGVVGVHPSLLPKYRGASPIQSAILNGETETGVTIYRMDEKMDHGPILASATTLMDSLTIQYPTLEEKLAVMGGGLLVQTIPALITRNIPAHAQNDAAATYTKKFTTADAFVDEVKENPKTALRKINAFAPEPGAWTIRNGKRVKLLKAEMRGGRLHPLVIQEDGGTPMSTT